jgi:hypothetical protein
MKKPNFFIVGAPKCGTTALSVYLRSHPEIFFPKTKKLNNFNADFADKYRAQRGPEGLLLTDEDYLKLFKEATDEHIAIGEGTVWYLYSKEAMNKIRKFNPNAKIIVMLRNPIDLAFSLHNQELYSFNENVDDFESAWRLQNKRRRGEAIPRSCLEPKVLQYREICLLGSQLKKLYNVFPRDQVLTILFENFVSHTKETYENVLAFFDLESDGRQYFPQVNVRKAYRYRSVNYWLVSRAPLWIRKATKIIKIIVGVKDLGVYRIIKKCNTHQVFSKHLNPGTRKMLRDTFSDDIDLLGRLVAKNLQHWK